MAYKAQKIPATYKDASENFKLGLDEEQARVEKAAMEAGHVNFDPLANSKWGSENEIIEATRVQAEQKNKKDELLDTKIDNNEELSDDEIEYINTNIMYGTLPANKLSSYIGVLVKNNKNDMIRDILKNQAMLSVEQMKAGKSGYIDISVDRQFQFMQTLTTLKELGYDFNSLSFENKEGKKADFIKFMADYSGRCRENNATMSEVINSILIDKRIAYSPQLISSLFVEEEFSKNPSRFENEYQEYLESKKDSKFSLSFDDFMQSRYNITIKRLEEKLKMFEESRAKLLAEDKAKREALLSSMTKGANIFEEIEEVTEGRGR